MNNSNTAEANEPNGCSSLNLDLIVVVEDDYVGM